MEIRVEPHGNYVPDIPYVGIVLLLDNRYRYSSNGICLWSMSYLGLIIYAEFRKMKTSQSRYSGWVGIFFC